LEFFLEDCAGGGRVRGLESALDPPEPGAYPVLREDAAFALSGPGSYDVLAQVCNVNFADLELTSQPVIMTLMIGVAVLVVPQMVGAWPRFRIWCDPTFGPYLEESLGTVVTESGGNCRR
jgi:sarcosine oxidase subunit gamma